MKKSLWIAALAALIDRAAKLAWAAADFVLIPGRIGRARHAQHGAWPLACWAGRPICWPC